MKWQNLFSAAAAAAAAAATTTTTTTTTTTNTTTTTTTLSLVMAKEPKNFDPNNQNSYVRAQRTSSILQPVTSASCHIR